MMRRRVSACLLPGLMMLSGCHWPGRPQPSDEVPRPEAVMSFDKLYAANCAGCHGVNGQNGQATNLANPVYQALVDDVRCARDEQAIERAVSERAMHPEGWLN